MIFDLIEIIAVNNKLDDIIVFHLNLELICDSFIVTREIIERKRGVADSVLI